MKTYKIRFEKAAQKFLDKQDINQRLRECVKKSL